MKTKISLAVASALAIPLQASAEHQELPTIVVEGTYERPGTFSTAPDSSGLKDTASLLERVPGANVNRNGPLTGIAAYRGMYGNRINISVDGSNMKEVGPNSMDPPLSHIPAALTGSLKVHRGIAPVSSGIDTIGGAMKVESRKGDFAEGDGIETNGVASMGFSSVEDGHYGVLLGSVANKNHKAYLSGSQEMGNDYRIKNNQEQAPTEYDRNAFTAGYGYQRDGHELGINYSNNDTGHTGTPSLPMDIIYVRGGLYDANYSWDMGNGSRLKTNVYYQKMRHLMDNFTLRKSIRPMSVMMDMQTRAEVEAGGIDLAYSFGLFDGELTIGANGDQSNHDATMDNITAGWQANFFNDVERDRYSAFAEWTGEIADKLELELGARYTHTWTNAGDITGPAAGVVNQFNSSERTRNFNDVDLTAIFRYAMSSRLDLEVGFARKNRAPTYQELYLALPSEATGGLADGKTYVGDLDLEHETAYQFELGVDWHTAKAYVSPRAFYHYVDDYIQGDATARAQQLRAMTGRADLLQFANIEAQLFGVDVEAGYEIDENWRLDGGLNYVRGMRINSPTGDDDLYRIAPLNGRTQLTYQHSDWMGSIEGVFVADQGDVAGYNDELKTKGYMLMNLRGQYKPYKGIVIGAGIENVLDTKHFDHLNGLDRINSTATDPVRVASQGRNVYATLSYKW
ncbi:TonB-dependent receptor [Methylomarinum sp. Ch1-1]|uniref:TonB-dependent receptor n=1 Tax=Methylomarinum roseum TaxID=3067653 RepID=A0AAU7NTJ8_9GAMM|nr:TonB-dependent receptor [Methylomarinum sp. Ch1-1]MDP4520062.1 TonB-dependent receptor [Methylomarinum sp. Ch1-1]